MQSHSRHQPAVTNVIAIGNMQNLGGAFEPFRVLTFDVVEDGRGPRTDIRRVGILRQRDIGEQPDELVEYLLHDRPARLRGGDNQRHRHPQSRFVDP